MNEHEPTDPIGAAIREASESVRAPHSLREGIAAPRRSAVRWGLALAAGAVATVVVVLALSLGGGPSVQQVAQAALNAPTQPAPARDGHHIDAQIAGIRFPDYEGKWGWKAIGSRTDEVDGRKALTVIYAKGDLGVHYTVVDGDPLPAPDGARTVDVKGTPVAIERDGDTLTASWERNGHTCVLATRRAGQELLLDMVAWSY